MSTTKTDIVLNICCAMIINENTKPPLLAKHLKIKHPEHKDKRMFFEVMFKAIQHPIHFFQHLTTLTKYH